MADSQDDLLHDTGPLWRCPVCGDHEHSLTAVTHQCPDAHGRRVGYERVIERFEPDAVSFVNWPPEARA